MCLKIHKNNSFFVFSLLWLTSDSFFLNFVPGPSLEVIQMGVGMEHMHKKADPSLHWRSWEMQKWVRIVEEYWKVLPFPFPHVCYIMGDTKGQEKIKIINDKLPWLLCALH